MIPIGIVLWLFAVNKFVRFLIFLNKGEISESLFAFALVLLGVFALIAYHSNDFNQEKEYTCVSLEDKCHLVTIER